MTTKKKNSFFLLLASLIWGVAFVAQSEGGNAIGPFSFSCIRSFLAALVLLPVMKISDLRLGEKSKRPKTKEERKRLWIGGSLCGVFLCLATNLQQVGLFLGSTTGKAGFLTAIYILFVPLLGIFFRRKCPWNVWLGVAIAVGGLYLLCLKENFSVQAPDLLLLLCGLLFSGQILAVDHFSPLVDGIRLSVIQHLLSGILSAFPMIFYDIFTLSGSLSAWAEAFTSLNAWIPLLYAGILSSGVAYTLQIIGQKQVNPTVAALLMSLESVFSALAGWVILRESLSVRELFGCALVFIAILLAQIPLPFRRNGSE